jgi:hypothetical protein
MTTTEESWCVRLQHEGGRRIYEATKDLPRDGLIAWWGERNREFREHVERLSEERRVAKPPSW